LKKYHFRALWDLNKRIKRHTLRLVGDRLKNPSYWPFSFEYIYLNCEYLHYRLSVYAQPLSVYTQRSDVYIYNWIYTLELCNEELGFELWSIQIIVNHTEQRTSISVRNSVEIIVTLKQLIRYSLQLIITWRFGLIYYK